MKNILKNILLLSLIALALHFHINALHNAASEGNAGKVANLLKKGASVHQKDVHGTTPLHEAASNGHEPVVQLLIAAGAKNLPDDSDTTPLHSAANNGHKEIVQQLMKSGATLTCQDFQGNTPLHEAVVEGQKEVVTILLALSNPEIANMQNKQGDTALHIAAKLGHAHLIPQLIQAQANLNPKNMQEALYVAAQFGHNSIIDQLLSAGTQLDIFVEGNTPLHITANKGSITTLCLLLEKSYRPALTKPQEKKYSQKSLIQYRSIESWETNLHLKNLLLFENNIHQSVLYILHTRYKRNLENYLNTVSPELHDSLIEIECLIMDLIQKIHKIPESDRFNNYYVQLGTFLLDILDKNYQKAPREHFQRTVHIFAQSMVNLLRINNKIALSERAQKYIDLLEKLAA